MHVYIYKPMGLGRKIVARRKLLIVHGRKKFATPACVLQTPVAGSGDARIPSALEPVQIEKHAYNQRGVTAGADATADSGSRTRLDSPRLSTELPVLCRSIHFVLEERTEPWTRKRGSASGMERIGRIAN